MSASEPAGSKPAGGAGQAQPPTSAPKRSHGRGWRWTGAAVLLVVGALLVTVSVLARYARGEIIDTDRYVATVAPLASNPAVQDAVTTRASNAIIERIDVPQLIKELADATGRPNAPAIANLISGPVNDYVDNLVHSKVQEFVQSPRFETLWVNANTVAHKQLSGVLTGRGTDVVTVEGEQVSLEVGPIVNEVKDRLVQDGFSVASKIPEVSLQVPVMTVEDLPKYQSYVRLLDTLATWLPFIALALFALGIWLAPGHRRGALIGAVLVAILMVLMLVALGAVRRAYESEVAARGLNVPAALAMYDTLLRFLAQAFQALLVVSVVAIVWLWLAGPGRVGQALRRWGRRAEEFVAGRLGAGNLRLDPVARFARRFGTAIIVGFAILFAWLFLRGPTIGLALWLSAGMVVIMLIVGTLSRLTSQPPATPRATVAG
jgi:hypothetical protein